MKDKKNNTKGHILEVGTRLVLQNGYHSVGINKVLEEADIPKGSFYYYFKSKEDFGLQVIKYYSQHALELLQSYLEDEGKDHKQRILSFFQDMTEGYRDKGYTEGCLLGNCSTELSDASPNFSTSIAAELRAWQEHFERCIREGQAAGTIESDEPPARLSDFILTAWEGALLRMKAAKSTESIDTFLHFLDRHLL